MTTGVRQLAKLYYMNGLKGEARAILRNGPAIAGTLEQNNKVVRAGSAVLSGWSSAHELDLVGVVAAASGIPYAGTVAAIAQAAKICNPQ